ncbi:hypothetical protein ADL22_10915 [Streptomyces sp. NRRL F-4489]|uniref:hypothetical protein n=1 Tax=Streptomyces sp. NRRL F-4489 TaxID=1609095 RepID=UPI00074A3B91|nr:hypothetical protein [Streptomyces sp. NRRL F-4489]KUL46022.1 hypothetical protein ADL22_10915 [Streptomyces sp. NRRL F-4489]
MTDPRQQLQDAWDALDAAFAPLAESAVSPVGGCTFCYAESDLATLTGPVAEVAEELIPRVAHEVPSHWDDFHGLYRRLMPRILRRLVADDLDHSLVASRLIAADWRAWPAPERSALEGFWVAWWRSFLHTYPGVGHVTDVLEILSATAGAPGPWLALWAETRTEAADQHLNDAINDWLIEDELADLHFGFYGEVHATPELLPWLLRLEANRVGADQLGEIERIAQG